MRRQLPPHDEVEQAMRAELRLAQDANRAPRVSAVERQFGIPHATFSRNYRDLIDWFQMESREQRSGNGSPRPKARDQTDDTLRRLRQENSDLRCIVEIYAAEIQRLTVDTELSDGVVEASKIKDAAAKRTSLKPRV